MQKIIRIGTRETDLWPFVDGLNYLYFLFHEARRKNEKV